MSAAPTELTLRQRIEATLLLHPGRGVALTRLYELLHDSTPEQMKAAWREADRLLRELYEQETQQ